MRNLDEENKRYHKEIVQELVKYAKKNQEEVFLGIRKNEIHLYVKGGSRFLKYNVMTENAEIDKRYIDNPKNYKFNMKDKLNNGKLYEKLDELKNKVNEYKTKTSKEKEFKQKLIQEINSNSNYYAYDIEYRYNSNNKELNKKCKNELKGKYSQPDLMIISKPNNENKVKIIIGEVKYQCKSFGKKEQGSGIVGHVGKFVSFINLANTDKEIKKDLLNEVKYIMGFYQKNHLITNKKFTKINYDGIELEDGSDALQFCFILGGCNDSIEKSFRKYLGIGDKNAKITVKNSLNKGIYPNKEKMLDFKYFRYDNDFNIKFDFEEGGKKILKEYF